MSDEIVPFERRHGRALAKVFADAFLDDPIWTAIGPRNRTHRRFSNRASFGGIIAGSRRHNARMRVALRDGEVAGGTIAFASEDWPMPDRAVFWEAGWFLAAGPLPALRGFRDDAAIREHHVAYPHSYLWFIGVAPAAQGTGVGHSLMADLHGWADPLERPVYLETGTESNLAWYGSLGYGAEGEIEMPSGATMWRMERPASG